MLHKDAEPKFGSAHSHDLIYRGRQPQRLDGYTTDLFTDESIAFIDRHPQQPWFGSTHHGRRRNRLTITAAPSNAPDRYNA